MNPATALGFLQAAQHLLLQAAQQAPDLFGDDLQEALRLLAQEAADAAESVRHDANVALAARLGPGFSYSVE